MGNLVLMILDSVGIGELPDAKEYDDVGSNTLLHIAERIPHFDLPNLESLGLRKIEPKLPQSKEKIAKINSLYGKMKLKSKGKDTTIGHWELMGLVLNSPMNTFPNGFSKEMMEEFKTNSGHDYIGNYPASGTEIIKDLGQKHVDTKKLIVYTSADSVLQIAAHEDVIPLPELYRVCEIARKICDKHNIARVIARPFKTVNGVFTRTENRKDFSINPPKKSVLNYLQDSHVQTIGVGKIDDIFNSQGIQKKVKSKGNKACIQSTLELMKSEKNSFIFTNLVDFDMLYGHRRDPFGYYDSLKEFDLVLPEIMKSLNNDDLLIITADHGNDPTYRGTDHTREFVPVLAYSPSLTKETDLKIRESLSDVGKTILDYFSVPHNTSLDGESFYGLLS